MKESGKITIRLHVNGLVIPVIINREDEPYYREAAKTINSTVANYTQIFSEKKSESEIMAMAMIDIALRNEQNKVRNSVALYDDILLSLTKEVEEVLDESASASH
ncbi:MAG: cell division protein ZapA [Bacteroidaceae bacterium]|nr:cell division protein ZapA [Bacteroidaceae bacterium]